jgi:hypothetical protein
MSTTTTSSLGNGPDELPKVWGSVFHGTYMKLIDENSMALALGVGKSMVGHPCLWGTRFIADSLVIRHSMAHDISSGSLA